MRRPPINAGSSSIHHPPCQPVIRVDAAVAQERPVRSRDIHLAEVNRYEQRLLLVGAGAGENLAERAGNEALAPELQAVSACGAFVADTIGRGDIAAVGDRVTALNQFPCALLARAVLLLFLRMPADG